MYTNRDRVQPFQHVGHHIAHRCWTYFESQNSLKPPEPYSGSSRAESSMRSRCEWLPPGISRYLKGQTQIINEWDSDTYARALQTPRLFRPRTHNLIERAGVLP